MSQYPYYPVNADLGAIVTLTAASASGETVNYTNSGGRGLQLRVDITAISGTDATLTVTAQGYDSASGSYFTLLASAGLTATGFTLMTILPGTTAASNTDATVPVPAYWRVSYTITGTTPSVTGTIGACTLV